MDPVSESSLPEDADACPSFPNSASSSSSIECVTVEGAEEALEDSGLPENVESDDDNTLEWFCPLSHKTSAELFTRWFSCEGNHRVCGGCRDTQKGFCFICEGEEKKPLVWMKTPHGPQKIRLTNCEHVGCISHLANDEIPQHTSECNFRPMLCFETCGNTRCLGRPVPERNFNEHLQNDHRLELPPNSGNIFRHDFSEEVATGVLKDAGYATRLRPKYVWLAGRLFLRTMIYFSENLFVAFNLAEGSEHEANQFTLTATVNKDCSNTWQRRWTMQMNGIRSCFGRFLSHPVDAPAGSFYFQIDFGDTACKSYQIRYEIQRPSFVPTSPSRILRGTSGLPIRRYVNLNQVSPNRGANFLRYPGEGSSISRMSFVNPLYVAGRQRGAVSPESRMRVPRNDPIAAVEAQRRHSEDQNDFNQHLERAREFMASVDFNNDFGAEEEEQDENANPNVDKSDEGNNP